MKEHIIETVEVSRRDGVDKLANVYLKLGWVIIDTWVVGYGGNPEHERMETFHVLLGWIDKSSKPVHPPKSKGF
jgi:hypothetical protein